MLTTDSNWTGFLCSMWFMPENTSGLNIIKCPSETVDPRRVDLWWPIYPGFTLKDKKVSFVHGVTSEFQKSVWGGDLEGKLKADKCITEPQIISLGASK